MTLSGTKISDHATRGSSVPAIGTIDASATPFLVGIFAYILMLAVGQRLLGDPDTFLHIAAGNWIWAQGRVPPVDPFSFTFQGAPWIAHEWLSELIFAGAFAALGWAGVVAITAAAVAVTFALLAKFLECSLSRLASLLGVTTSFLLASSHLIARPHVLAMPLLVAWAVCLDRSRTCDRTPSILILPLMTLWANLHGGFIIGLGLAGIYAADSVIAQPDWPMRWQAARHWSIFLLGAALASLITPYGIEGPLFAFHLTGQTFALSVINEWRSTDFASFQPLEIWILALLALGFSMRLRLPPMKLIILLCLIHLALVHRRNTDVLALIGPILFAVPVAQALPQIATSVTSAIPRARFYLLTALVAAIATGVAQWHGIDHDEQKIAPTHALAAAAAASVTGPVLNAYDFGGYLIFAGISPFVDGRVDLYGDQFMHDYADAVSGSGDALSKTLERYHITWTLLAPSMTAVALLDRMPGWERLYSDDNAVIHRRVDVGSDGDRRR
jgi:hypothetical protein